MKKTIIYVVLVIMVSSFAACSSGAKMSGKPCGCNMHKGYVGY